jgi:hypothetical protein
LRGIVENRETVKQSIRFEYYSRDVEFSPGPWTIHDAARAFTRLQAIAPQHAVRATEIECRALHGNEARCAAFETLLSGVGEPDRALGLMCNTRFANFKPAEQPAAAKVLIEHVGPKADDSDLDRAAGQMDFLDDGRRPDEDVETYLRDMWGLRDKVIALKTSTHAGLEFPGTDNVLHSLATRREPGQTLQQAFDDFHDYAQRMRGAGVEDIEYGSLYSNAIDYDRSSYEKAFGTTSNRGLLDGVANTLLEAGDVVRAGVDNGGDFKTPAAGIEAAAKRLEAMGVPHEDALGLLAEVSNNRSTVEDYMPEAADGLVPALEGVTRLAEQLHQQFEVPGPVLAPLLGDAIGNLDNGMEVIVIEERPEWLKQMEGTIPQAGKEASLATQAARTALLWHYASAYAQGRPGQVPPKIAQMAEDWQLWRDFDVDAVVAAKAKEAAASGRFSGKTEAELAADIRAQMQMARLMGASAKEAADAAVSQLDRARHPADATVRKDGEYVVIGGLRVPIRKS